MFAKLKAWAAALWLAIKFELNGGRETQLMQKLNDSLNREDRYKDQAERWQALFESKCDEIREIGLEIGSLKAIRNGLEQDAAILVRRQKEDAAKIEELSASVQFYGDRVKTVEKDREFIKQELEARLKQANVEIRRLSEHIESQDKTLVVMAGNLDCQARAVDEWQGQCERLTTIIKGTRVDADELLVVRPKGHCSEVMFNVVGEMSSQLRGRVVVLGNEVDAWKATPILTPGNTSATEQSPEPEIATIGDVLTENRRRALAEVMFGRNTTGVESTIRGDGDIETVGHSLNGKPPLTCPNCGCGVGSYITNRDSGLSSCEHCQEKPPTHEQLADEARRYQNAAKLWPNGPKG